MGMIVGEGERRTCVFVCVAFQLYSAVEEETLHVHKAMLTLSGLQGKIWSVTFLLMTQHYLTR